MSESQIQSSTSEFHGRQVHTVSAEIAGRTLTLETGRLAELADGAVTDHATANQLVEAMLAAHGAYLPQF